MDRGTSPRFGVEVNSKVGSLGPKLRQRRVLGTGTFTLGRERFAGQRRRLGGCEALYRVALEQRGSIGGPQPVRGGIRSRLVHAIEFAFAPFFLAHTAKTPGALAAETGENAICNQFDSADPVDRNRPPNPVIAAGIEASKRLSQIGCL